MRIVLDRIHCAALATLLVVGLAATSSAGTFGEEGGDAGGSAATAQVIQLDEGMNTITGTTDGLDIDFFAIDIPVAGLTTFEITDGGGADFFLALFDPTATLYMADDDSGAGLLSRLVAFIPTPGRWFLGVSLFANVPEAVLDFGGQGMQGFDGGPVPVPVPVPIPGPGPGPFANFRGAGDNLPLLPGEEGDFKPFTRLQDVGNDRYFNLFEHEDPPFVVMVVVNPEPGTIALFSLGLLGLGVVSHRRRRRRLLTTSA